MLVSAIKRSMEKGSKRRRRKTKRTGKGKDRQKKRRELEYIEFGSILKAVDVIALWKVARSFAFRRSSR